MYCRKILTMLVLIFLIKKSKVTQSKLAKYTIYNNFEGKITKIAMVHYDVFLLLSVL